MTHNCAHYIHYMGVCDHLVCSRDEIRVDRLPTVGEHMETNKHWIVKKIDVSTRSDFEVEGENLNYKEGQPGRKFIWALQAQYITYDRYDYSNAEITPAAAERMRKMGVKL